MLKLLHCHKNLDQFTAPNDALQMKNVRRDFCNVRRDTQLREVLHEYEILCATLRGKI
jgi:hypothetical protein